MKATDTQRNMALCLELETAIRLIQAGLGQLQQISFVNNFYHLPLLTLASGFERLMKVIICLHYFENNGQYPGIDYLKKVGHDLDGLLSRIQEDCFAKEYREGLPAGKRDIECLVAEDLRCLVRLLGDFARSARYHYLDVVAGAGELAGSPEDRWDAIETNILRKNRPDFLATLGDEAFEYVSSEIVIRFERLARALARLFTVGNLSQRSREFTGLIKPFLFLRDEDLGKTKYSPWGKNAP
jgi:hypothetical protein